MRYPPLEPVPGEVFPLYIVPAGRRPNTDRLYPLRPHPEQRRLVESKARFKVVPAGRRSGKTERAKRQLIAAVYQAAIDGEWPDPRFFAAAPTRDQAKAIYWNDLKAMVPRQLLAERPRETELMIKFVTGAELCVVGMDKPERIEGRPWNGGILDEFANMKPGAWGENVRPALSDRKGWCWLIGVPEGRNHYYDIAKMAGSGDDPDWDLFTWPSSDILDPEEIASAKRSLDPLVFQQEYEASFVNFVGRAYYPFLESSHCAPLFNRYNPRATLNFCFDFNVEPGVCAVIQELVLPGQFEKDDNGLLMLDSPITGSAVISEVHIPRNSTTEAVCKKLLTDWNKHQGRVRCYGDATGGARGSAKVLGSDWDLIRGYLRDGMPNESLKGFGEQLQLMGKRSNPPERSRINAVNSRMRSGSGEIRMMVDPKHAPNVVKDFEGVRLLEGGSGEIDKKADPKLSHISDAIGYYIHQEFPITGYGIEVRPLRI